ncbi:MAG: glycosyltransferase family 2 protein, partial [Nitrospiraceae bacterium]
MSQLPSLSVVVPAHARVDLYLSTIASLRAQTLPEFELIVTDDSWQPQDRQAIEDAVLRYRTETGRVAHYLFTEPGLGQARNTNQGLRAASGELIRILHSDDLLHPDCLAWECRQVRDLAPLSLLFQDCLPFRREEDLTWDADPLVRLVDPYQHFEQQLSASTALPSATDFRREAQAAAGGMRADWSFLCDWELFAKMLLWCGQRNERVAHAAAGLFGWRLHQASTTSIRWRDHFTEHQTLMREWQGSLPGGHAGLFEDSDLREAFFARGEDYRRQRLYHDCEQLGWREYLSSVPWLLRNDCLWPTGLRPKRKLLSHLWRRLRGRKPREGTGPRTGRRPAETSEAWVPDLTLSSGHGDEGATRNTLLCVQAFDNRLNLWPVREQIGRARRLRINHVCENHLFRRSIHECLNYVQPGTEVEGFFHGADHLSGF